MIRSKFSSAMSILRQWMYAKEFRIYSPNTVGLETVLPLLVKKIQVSESIETESTTQGVAGELSDNLAFVKKLCNQHFRIQLNLKKMIDTGENYKQVLNMRKSIQNTEKLLVQNGIESLDLTGEEADEGRVDFEVASEDEIMEKLSVPTVIECMQPAISVNGKLIQKAIVVVGRPPDS